jgi:uncharacterized RDD family membrane protein YckC
VSEGPNPFEPPKADWESGEGNGGDPEIDDELVDASQSTRFANYFVDVLVQIVIIAVLSTFGDSGAELLVSVGYFIVFEGFFARTPGKWLTKTRVVTLAGDRPSFGQILGRTLARMVPFEPFSFLGRNRRGWHDRWSNTRVVRDRKRGARRRKRRGKRDDD